MITDCYLDAVSLQEMAAELLVKIDNIDLSATICDEKEVDKFLPQTGHMRMVDRVIWLSPDGTAGLGERVIRHDEFWVEGHIPGRPIFPGVLMIEAAAQLCSLLHKRLGRASGFLGFTRCNDVVFRGQVTPGDRLLLLSKEVEFNRRRFISKAQGVVNGKLVFEGTITGMAI
jgi:3-hydroxyacyl-[acyl-carrier-protein] dehydratase